MWCHTKDLLTMMSQVRDNNSIDLEHPMRLGISCSLIYSSVWKLWPEFLGISEEFLRQKMTSQISVECSIIKESKNPRIRKSKNQISLKGIKLT